jgi:hypothetical protein
VFVCGSLALFKAKENEPTQTVLTLFGAEEIAPTWCLTDWNYIVWKQATFHKKEDGEFPWKSPIQTLLRSIIAIRVVGVRSWGWSWVGFHVCQIFSCLFEDTTFSPCTHLFELSQATTFSKKEKLGQGKISTHKPTHHARWMMCGWETIFGCIHIPWLTMVDISYVFNHHHMHLRTYLRSTHQVTK